MIYTHKYSVLRWIQIKARDVFVNSNIWQKKINRRWRCDSLISEEDGPCSSYNSTSYPHLSTLQSDRHKRKSWNNPHHLLKSFSGFSPGGNESSLCVWCWGHLKSIMSPCFQCRAFDPPSEERDDQHSALQDAIWQQQRHRRDQCIYSAQNWMSKWKCNMNFPCIRLQSQCKHQSTKHQPNENKWTHLNSLQ